MADLEKKQRSVEEILNSTDDTIRWHPDRSSGDDKRWHSDRSTAVDEGQMRIKRLKNKGM